MKISASIVLFKQDYSQFEELLEVLLSPSLDMHVFLIDNSPTNQIKSALPSHDRLSYFFCGRNLGYGGGHNVALREVSGKSTYHLILNPDIQLDTESIQKMIRFMNFHPNTGLMIPRVLYSNGEHQNTIKLLPTPFDLILRRFLPGFVQYRFQKRFDWYEMKQKDLNQTFEVPQVSGCFMFIRTNVLDYIGFFDERFFLYLEDTDFTRRINMLFQTLYYPEVSIIHRHERGSYKSKRLLKYHILSAFSYFNKYGWFYDPVRTTLNRIYG